MTIRLLSTSVIFVGFHLMLSGCRSQPTAEHVQQLEADPCLGPIAAAPEVHNEPYRPLVVLRISAEAEQVAPPLRRRAFQSLIGVQLKLDRETFVLGDMIHASIIVTSLEPNWLTLRRGVKYKLLGLNGLVLANPTSRSTSNLQSSTFVVQYNPYVEEYTLPVDFPVGEYWLCAELEIPESPRVYRMIRVVEGER